ncbi:MAG: FAD-dependent oxidoreductase [Nitrospirota bacterium]|nr:FAD-dependent oxidoreductase [Nitrospirota bacterium]
MNSDVLIIGAGLAGLSCASTLESSGISYLVLEASDMTGGRVRTDHVNGFLLDRGFQVFSTAYPEAQRQLDYSALKLHHFSPGAVIRFGGKWHRMLDPFRHPFSALEGLLTPIGTFSDKCLVAKFRHRALSGTIPEVFSRQETSTLRYLQDFGFSASMIERFFRPFLGGVFLDRELKTSSRMAEFIFRMFASGDTSLPSEGMGAISQQLCSRLPPEKIRTQARVTSIHKTTVILESGESLTAHGIVVATEGPVTGELIPSLNPPPYGHATTLYFSAPETPFKGPYLLLNGEGVGPINNLCVLSQVAPTYSKNSQQLLSVSVLNRLGQSESDLESEVRRQLKDWFGTQEKDWQHLHTSTITAAQPKQIVPFSNPYSFQPNFQNGTFVCGDFCATGTIDGALYSGRRAGKEICDWLER